MKESRRGYTGGTKICSKSIPWIRTASPEISSSAEVASSVNLNVNLAGMAAFVQCDSLGQMTCQKPNLGAAWRGPSQSTMGSATMEIFVFICILRNYFFCNLTCLKKPNYIN